MDKKYSQDPRSVRARHALQNALIELLKEKPYQKITVTDIARKADLARHTFYNHFEIKDDLLEYYLDSVINELFSYAEQIDYGGNTNEESFERNKEIWLKYFQIWKDNAKILSILNSINLDIFLIKRMRQYLNNYINKNFIKTNQSLDSTLIKYALSHNSYAVIGVLMEWINEGMHQPPEIIAEFMASFSSAGKEISTISKFEAEKKL